MNPATALAPSMFMPLGTSPHPASAVSKAGAGPAKTTARAKPWAPASAWGPEVRAELTRLKNGGGKRSADTLVARINSLAEILADKSGDGYRYAVNPGAIKRFNREVDSLLFDVALGSGKFAAQPLLISPTFISSLRSFADALVKRHPKREEGAALMTGIATSLESANNSAPLMAKVINQVLRNQKTPASNRLAEAIKGGIRSSSGHMGFNEFLIGPDGWLAKDLKGLV